MNLDRMKKLKINLDDIRSFSLGDVRDFVNQQQVLALTIVIIMAVVVILIYVFNLRSQEYQSLKSQMEVLQLKEEPVRGYEQSVKLKGDFWRKIPPFLPGERLIPYVTSVATLRHITIDAFEPLQLVPGGFYSSVNIVFSCSALSFKDALLFIHDMEASGYLIKVDSWTMKKAPEKYAADGSETAGAQTGVVMTVAVSSVKLMESNDNKSSRKK